MSKSIDKSLLLRFGNSLRKVRVENGLSQEELSFKCGLDRTYISGLERGIRNPTLNTLSIISKNINISISALILGIDNSEDRNE